MSILDRVVEDLHSVAAALGDQPALAQRVDAIAQLLAEDDTRWISLAHAQRLLGVRSTKTVKAWIRLGLLRSQQGPTGRLRVSLDDVLTRRTINAELAGIGDNQELSSAEHRIMERPLSGDDVLQQVFRELGISLPELPDSSAATR